MERLLDRQDLADYFGVCKDKISHWCMYDKDFPKPVKRRWRESVIENYIIEQEKKKLEEANRERH